ncbi:hypothetical protein Bca101_074838 [Brassica carinata]
MEATARIFTTSPLNPRLLLTKINLKPYSFSLESTNYLCFFPSRIAVLREPSISAALTRCSASRSVNGGGNGTTFGENGKETTVVLLVFIIMLFFLYYFEKTGCYSIILEGLTPLLSPDFLRIDLGGRLEERIAEFGNDLANWVSEKEDDGREKCLMFHCFKSTIQRWYVASSALSSRGGGGQVICIVASICADILNIVHSAAGFTAAILKKRSSTINIEPTSPRSQEEDVQKKEPLGIENMMLSSLEKLFPIILNIPDLFVCVAGAGGLTKIVEKLYENHPPCPQLYLYSSGDKVEQKIGRNINSFNFRSFPHVDHHYRSFPDLYSLQLYNFLQECFKLTKQQQQTL